MVVYFANFLGIETDTYGNDLFPADPYLAYIYGSTFYRASDGYKFELDLAYYDFPIIRVLLNHGTAKLGIAVSWTLHVLTLTNI